MNCDKLFLVNSNIIKSQSKVNLDEKSSFNVSVGLDLWKKK